MSRSEDIVGKGYVDATGRKLEVTGYQPGDPLGRDIIGKVSSFGPPLVVDKDYATTVETFQAVWIDGAKRWRGKEEQYQLGS
jgi:hypothetical protein